MTSQAANTPISLVEELTSWFSLTLPSPNFIDTHHQFARLIEQHIDMLVSLQEAGVTTHARDEIGFSIQVLDFLKRRFSAHPSGIEIGIEALDRVSLLRALCQQIVTAVGIAYALDMKIDGALDELVRSNKSSLDDTGTPIFNLQRKLVPASGYKSPDYSAYI